MASKAFFSIEFQGGAELIRELSAVELELKKVQDQIKAAQKAGDGDAYKNLRVQQEDLKRSSAELRKEIKAQATAFEKAQFPKDSLIGLEQQYSSLRAEIRGFSKDYRESAAGIAKIRLADSLKSQILEIDNSIKDFKSNIGNYKSGLSSLSNVGDIITGGLVTGGITAAIGAVVAFGKESVAAFKESEIAITAVATAVTTTGKAAGFTVEQLAQEAENLMKNTVFDDDQILKDVTSQLLTFTNVTGDTFLRAQKSALDLNTVIGGDLQGTTIQLGKALENPVKGVTALSKAGVTFTEQQKAQIKTLVESNKVQEAQAIILDEINAKYGDQAEALANTPTGRLKQLSNIFGELEEKVGGFVVNGLGKIVPVLGDIIVGISAGLDYFYQNVLLPIGVSFSRLFDVIFEGAGKSEVLNKVFAYLGIVFNSVASIITTFVDGVSDAIIWLRRLEEKSPAVGFVFEKIRDRISGFVELITNIPALLAAVLKGFAQFVNNVRNFDFSKSSIAVGVEEFKKITEQRKIEEKKVEVKAQGAKSPTNGLAGGKKDGDKERKAEEDQQKRIEDIKKKIRDLSAKEIANEFDRQVEQAKNKAKDELAALKLRADELKGKKDPKSKEELGLIEQETELIKNGLDKQIAEIKSKRAEAIASAQKQLKEAEDSNLTAIKKAGAEALEAKLELINADANLRNSEIELSYTVDLTALKSQLDEGLITQKEFDQLAKARQSNFNEEKLAAEKDASAERLKIYDEELAARIGVYGIELAVAKRNIEDIADDRKKKLRNDFESGKIDAETYQKSLSAIDEKAALDKEKITLSTDQKVRIEQAKTADLKIQANEKIAESDSELSEKQKKQAEQRVKNIEYAIEQSLNLAGNLSDAILQNSQESADREKDDRLKSLDDEYEKRFALADGNKTLEIGLKKQLEEDKQKIEREAFEKNKRRQIQEALINAALAAGQIAYKAFIDPFGINVALQLGFLAANTAIQIATIKNAKFARGGFTGIGHGAPDETGHVPVGVVHANEWVANPEMVRDNPELFQRLEFEQATKYRRATHKKLFADGGFTSAIPDVIGINKVAQGKQSAAVFSNDQMKAFAQEVAQQTYEAVKAGSMEGTKDGVYTGQNEVNRLRERQDVLATNSTF